MNAKDFKRQVAPEYRDLFMACVAAGWRIERYTDHVVAYSPDKSVRPSIFNSKPCSPKSVKNKRCELRRAGLPV